MEYKVITTAPVKIEAELNARAQEGWRVRAMSAFGVNDFELLVVLEREKKGA